MKLTKTFVVLCSAFLLTGCTGNEGAALSVENASQYLQPLEENVGNANYSNGTVTFSIYPNVQTGKLFSSDIKGKCSVTVKFLKGLTTDITFNWSDPVEINDVAFVYKEGGSSDSGFKQADYLAASFSHSLDYAVSMANVYNLKVTEISGHMLP